MSRRWIIPTPATASSQHHTDVCHKRNLYLCPLSGGGYWYSALGSWSSYVDYSEVSPHKKTIKSSMTPGHNNCSCTSYFNTKHVFYLKMLVKTLEDPYYFKNHLKLVAVVDPSSYMTLYDYHLQKPSND